MLNSLLESKKYNKIHIENDQDVKNPSMAPLIVDGGSVFKKPAYFLNSIIIGPNKDEKQGTLAFKQGEFMGFTGDKWVTFSQNNSWKEDEGILYVESKRIGINKVSPKKMLEVGGDVAIDKKLHVRDEVTMDSGFQLGDNMGKKKRGMVRFWDNTFEGYDGEKWVKFGGEAISEKQEIPQINLDSVDKLKLINCPLTFLTNNLETHFYYDSEKNEFRLERLDKNFKTINHENLSLGNLKLNGDIIFEQGSRKTISNVSDPISENEVATKRYVDQMCSGLQEYIVADFLLLEEDVIYIGEEMEILRQVGDLQENKLVFILTPDISELVLIVEMGEKIKVKSMIDAQLPAKLLIKDGKYGNSEYMIFNNNNYMQLNGMESLEYVNPLQKIGKEIKLKFDKNIFTNDLSIKEKSIISNFIAESSIESIHIKNESIQTHHLADNIVDSRHLGQKVINSSHLQVKCIGDMHLKDGFLKNNHFTPGIISEKELGNECVGMTSLKSGIILNKHLTKNCVTGDNIFEKEIDGRHLQEKLIDSKHLKERLILSEHLSNNLIRNVHLGDKIIESKNISDGVISTEHLKNGIISKEHLMVNIVNGYHIQEGSILGAHIKEQTIIGNHLGRNVIQEWHLNDGIVRRNHLEDGCVDSVKLCDGAINERHLSENSVGQNTVKKGSINGNHIMMNSVDDRHIVNYSIKTGKLMDGAVIESKLAENSVSTGKIKDKSISNDKMKLPFIKISSDPVFTVTQMVNLGETLNLGLNPNYMIPKRRDGIVEFLSNIRFGEEGSGQKMEVNMELEVKSDVVFMGNVRVNENKLYYLGEIRAFWDRMKPDENFLKYWVKCDGARVRKTDYPELGEIMNEEEFYLPDLKADNMQYYIRIKL